MSVDLILGTAGHIDHGKTALVKRLTGIDTDRLPEEKKRGITIELGFAKLDLDDLHVGIVDVPGHERFVRNMLAGATGIDMALLVVAADDSVKPQTREHLEILRLLRLQAGVIALTKCDLPQPEWIELVEEEVRELVSDTFLADAPIIRTSAHTGAGIEALRGALSEAARRAAAERPRPAAGTFRLPIDRAFTIAGHGTVVTGSVVSGELRVGDELNLEPGGKRARVRGLQNHDQVVERVHQGQRAAVNLAGIRHDEIARGHELSSPGYLTASRIVTVRLALLEAAPRPLKHRSRVRCHVGTAELMAGVSLLDRDQLHPGEEALAQLFLSAPAVTTHGQAFVIRTASPVETIGGGQVLDPDAARIRRQQAARIARLPDLLADDPLLRASAALYLRELRSWQPTDLYRLANVVDADGTIESLTQRGDLVQMPLGPSRTARIHRGTLEELCDRISRAIARLHERAPLFPTVDRSQIINRFAYLGDTTLIDAALAHMQAAGQIRVDGGRLALAEHRPQLSSHEQTLYAQIIAEYFAAGSQPPSAREVKDRATRNQASVPQLIALAAAQGELVHIDGDYFLHAQVERGMRQRLAERLAEGEGLSVSQIRELFDTTRKYAVPYCEYLDRTGFTRREGDKRVRAGGRAETPSA